MSIHRIPRPLAPEPGRLGSAIDRSSRPPGPLPDSPAARPRDVRARPRGVRREQAGHRRRGASWSRSCCSASSGRWSTTPTRSTPTSPSPTRRRAPGHPLGTDPDGYDVLGRLMVGGQVSLEVGLAAAVLATVLGTLWGAVAGYFGGFARRGDDARGRRAALHPDAVPRADRGLDVPAAPKFALILVIALTSWLTTSRLVRGEALSLRVRDYVQAMQVMGGGGPRAVLRHIAPNAVGTIIVNATFQVADAILLVVALSYLGLGIPPPHTDWGGMLSNGVNYGLRRLLVADLPGRHRHHPASSSPSTSSATRCGTRSRSGCSGADPPARSPVARSDASKTCTPRSGCARSVVHAIDGVPSPSSRASAWASSASPAAARP